jgi:hypothetical protein
MNTTLAEDSLLLDYWLSDSLSLIALIDSLIYSDYRFSSLAIRLSYVSDIVNAGRNFGFDQYGISGGVSYYHKTGLFGDVTGYWNSDIEPNYNLTSLTAGYMGNILTNWSYIGSYEHYFYSDSEDYTYPLTNAMDVTTYYDFKFISTGIDYTFLFGEKSAHRIRPNIYSTIRFKKVSFLDEIILFPSASILLGNQNIYYLNENYQVIGSIIRKIGLRRFLILYRNNQELIDSLIYEENFENVFGLMNYSFSLPISLKIKQFSFSLGYFYNIPVALPGEEIDLSPNHYFNFMILYYLPFKSK